MNDPDPPTRELLDLLRSLDDLNPDIPESLHARFLGLAERIPGEDFPAVCAQVERLAAGFEDTPTKQVGRQVMQEYFQCIEASARMLARAGEIRALPPAGPAAPGTAASSRSFSDKLVLYIPGSYDALEQCKILNRARVPEPLGKAAAAFRRRLEVVSHVTGIGFEILWRIDPVRTERWFLRYLEAHDRELDPEIIRDILEIVLRIPELSPGLRRWVDRWCEDEALAEFWPLIAQLADRAYARQALKVWRRSAPPRDAVTAHLQSLVRRGALSDEDLHRWLTIAMENFGVCVENVISIGRRPGRQDPKWRQAALYTELRHLAALFPPILILSHQLLYVPDGAAKLAMALLGLVGQGLQDWEDRIDRQSGKIILRLFLENLRNGETPLKTIRKLTFGDQEAFQAAAAELDLMTQQFDSISQRDKVIGFLATFYSSFRRDKLLGVEVTRRYRNLMRLLHEDHLRIALPPEDFEAIRGLNFIPDLNGLAAAARHYLDKRRALQNSLEEMLAGEMEFKHQVRTRRLAAIRKLFPAENN